VSSDHDTTFVAGGVIAIFLASTILALTLARTFPRVTGFGVVGGAVCGVASYHFLRRIDE
jgi:hypothetical protein